MELADGAAAECAAASERGGVRKHAVVFALFVLSMITYIDRVCISAAKAPISAEMNLSDTAIGLVFSAFALGYALAQIPSGWFADKAGPRVALAAVVGMWSVLTALTGAAWSLTSLVAIRFLFGISEAGAFPGSVRAICNWLPPGERGRANGFTFSGSRLGAALSFPLLAWMLTRWQWRTAFLILGGIGLAWAAFWLIWFRNYPAQRLPAVASPKTAIGLAEVFRSRPMAFAMLQYFASNFTFFICLSWMLPYLRSQYHLGDSRAAAYAMAPLLCGATSQWVAGWIVDRLYHSPWRAWSRRLPGIMGFALAATGVLAVTTAATPGAAVFYFTLAVFGADMTISPSWVFCTDIAGKDAGSVSGAMNMLGNIGSFVSANAFPYLQGATGSASAYFEVAAALNLIGAICWFNMRSIGEEEAVLLVPGQAS
jgi:ACS family glucarate transporter-like MFS transporter